MPTYTVTIVNEHFTQSGEQESSDNIEAWKSAISSAIAIGADQVSHGSPFFGAEVIVTQGKQQLGRYVVSVGATSLKD
ncbi:hypothetical protein C8J25_10354 [Sphingomonas faeni]|uniref:Uncharacterized protein n=1 Tax=Sphingomonas faeni TaxID=185950 RepID=A0A2T5U756_9SPHN|nr:hypothetical protein [Sphingomonas faeni]PTW47339.1 hypothetical protein C8J25_10354 [Sphingomonas faeni]